MTKKKQAKARRAKTTPFRIRNQLVKILSLRGDSRSNPKLNEFYTKWIASLTLAMTMKNNLVKSFLTSIKFTFDSLSRKIKNPCLV
ncbi:hypothetical protein EZH24_13470, partial [Brachyspira catarrhinii]